MTGRSNWEPCRHKFQTLATLLYNRRCKVVSGGGPWRLPPFDLGRGGTARDQGLRFIGASFSSDSGSNSMSQTREIKSDNKAQEVHDLQVPAASKSSGFNNWVKWLWGSLISVMLPFFNNNWNGLLRLEGKVEKVVEEVEVTAEVVEKVAIVADKALAEVADQLPDNTKLKEAAHVMEHVSQVATHDAHLMQNVIHKVGDVKQDLEDLESMVDPVINRGHPRLQ